jgi:uncharacterized protein Yka (UPF0111/DUF47 family)
MTQPHGDPSPDPRTEGARRRWWHVLLPPAPNVLALLVRQGELTVNGMDAFNVWSHSGGAQAATAVRSAQHEAYHARRELLAALQAALSTPVDQEDLYGLSERIDRILNRARDTVREAEVLECAPNAHTAQMAERLVEGTRALVAGVSMLRQDPEEAGRRADAASDAVHHVERDYRQAMPELLRADDLRVIIAGQSVYRHYLDVAGAIVAVADRLWFVVLRGA